MRIFGDAFVSLGRSGGGSPHREASRKGSVPAPGRAFLAAWALAFILLLSVAPGAIAQSAPEPSEADQRAEADLLFKRMLVKPNDLDAAFRYSQIETKLGDYEAAIGALERMLFYNPNLPRVKLELGVLYFKLRSYEMARSYFTAAVAAKDTPQDVRDEVATFIAAIDRSVSDSQFALFAQFGLRHQTNGNAGPSSPVVQALGQNAILSSQFLRTPDWNAFGLTTLHHFYDFGDQAGNGWESDLTAYYARQFKLTNLNLGLIEASTGPRLGLGSQTVTSIHPYALANTVTLGDAEYFATVGGGASVRLQLPAAIELDPGVEYRDRKFSNSAAYPISSMQTGNQLIGYALGSGPLPMVAGLSWQGRLALTRDVAAYAPYSYNDLSVDLALPYAFAAPVFAQSPANWTFAPFVGYSHTAYKEPDFIVDPNVTRLDRQLRVGATLDMRFYQNVGFSLQAQYLRTDSTLSNYRTSDFIVSGGPTIRF
jgi:tetratricopeptide (TPR) repeat protein